MESEFAAGGIPASVPPIAQEQKQQDYGFTPPDVNAAIEYMKAKAREDAIMQVYRQQQQALQEQQSPMHQPQVVYVRRNLTVAELGLVLLLSCGIVTGLQMAWNFTANILPRIEFRMK